jgi:hypothetical protein
MAAGVTDRLWEVADLVAAWEASERRVERSGVGYSCTSLGWKDRDRPMKVLALSILSVILCFGQIDQLDYLLSPGDTILIRAAHIEKIKYEISWANVPNTSKRFHYYALYRSCSGGRDNYWFSGKVARGKDEEEWRQRN